MNLYGGKNGPSIKRVHTCKGCKWLSNKNQYYKKKSCLHPDIINKNKSNIIYDIFLGNISDELITPSFCPYLLSKIRKEKLKKINNK